jgi:hypothetical protein
VIGLEFKAAKEGFFDRAAVRSAVDKATRRALSKFGAFVRTRARTSIRKRRGTSPPGGPPFSHTGFLRRFIFFGYDRDRRSVVIGPVLAGSRSGAPENLEYGGRAEVRRRDGRAESAAVRPRPFMGPAFQEELPGFPDLWRDSVR